VKTRSYLTLKCKLDHLSPLNNTCQCLLLAVEIKMETLKAAYKAPSDQLLLFVPLNPCRGLHACQFSLFSLTCSFMLISTTKDFLKKHVIPSLKNNLSFSDSNVLNRSLLVFQSPSLLWVRSVTLGVDTVLAGVSHEAYTE
jgi:hypothetical protein